MQQIQLSDGTRIWNLTDEGSFQALTGKYADQNVVALRVHGLIGDCIKSTTVLSELIKEDPSRKYVYLISYNDGSKAPLVKELFKDLLETGVVVGLFLNNCQLIGNITFAQYAFLKEIGCGNILDLYYHSAEIYRTRKSGIAYLGFPHPVANPNKIALFRFSGFHRHVPLRHIREQDWNTLEQHFLNLGLEVHLYGHDDSMYVTPGVVDHRREFSVLDTIKHASDAGICVSTTTFLPVYMHHFVPCLVYVDPTDLPAVSLLWRSNHNYTPVNTQMPDYLSFVMNYVSTWRLAGLNSEQVLSGLLKTITK